MASQSQQISTSTVILATAGTLAAGAIAYAAYFDYRRRSDPEFRKNLKKQHKKVQKAKEEEGKAAEQGQKERIKNAVQEANEEGFPRDPEETEGYFMQEVARGEGMCQDGSDPVDAALCFYKALKVYPQPRELITIYDKTVPKVCLRRIAMDTIAFTDIPQPILDILAEMIAVDPSISVSSSTAGGDSANVE